MYTLPKIWKARVSKYWDKFVPVDYPATDAKFDVKFDTDEETQAVATFEAQLNTEESVVAPVIGENNFVSGYFGTFDVKCDANTETAAPILLSPEKIETKDEIAAFHYNTEEGKWEQIEDAQLKDGYVYGTLTSFSPVAIISYKKDIEVVAVEWNAGTKCAFANGNPVKVCFNDNNEVVMKNLSSGKTINLTTESITQVAGGTADGKALDSTDVFVEDIEAPNINFFAGSFFWTDAEGAKSTEVKSANLKIVNSTVRGVTGSFYMVHTNECNITLKNSKAYFVGAGQSYGKKGDVNGSVEDISMASAMWTLKSNIKCEDSEVEWLYGGGNTGYSYTVAADINLTGGKITGGIVMGGSNGRTDTITGTFIGVTAAQYIAVNRGLVGDATAKFKDSNIAELNVITSKESDTTGTLTGLSAIDIDKGTYTIVAGQNGGVDITDATNVKYVKVSRAADYTISDVDKRVLGDKFIVK